MLTSVLALTSRFKRLFESPTEHAIRMRKALGYGPGIERLHGMSASDQSASASQRHRHSILSVPWAAVYYVGALVVGAVAFLGSWIYCVASYGFLLGVGLGWLPSLIVAYIAGFAWPLLAGACVLLLLASFT